MHVNFNQSTPVLACAIAVTAVCRRRLLVAAAALVLIRLGLRLGLRLPLILLLARRLLLRELALVAAHVRRLASSPHGLPDCCRRLINSSADREQGGP